MKKIIAIILAALMLFTFVACGNNGVEGSKKGRKTLADKTPKELYDAAIEYIKGLTNYEILIDSMYNTTYDGQSTTESSTTLHRCSGDTFYYLYKTGTYEEFYIHDGSTLYQNVNNVREKEDMSYSDFMEEWGGVNEQGMLIELPLKNFENKLFIPEGDEFYLDFLITPEEYKEISGGEVTDSVTYRVYFDKNGTFTKFERSMSYYYYDTILVKDNMKVMLQNAGSAPKTEAPQNTDLYEVRVKAEDIDLSNVESLDAFETTDKITNYVILDMKIDGSVKVGAETVENYQGKILIRLFPEVAPGTVANFQNLVAGAFYNGLTIHRIVPDNVIQGGDPNGDGTGGSEDDIFGEFTYNGFTNNLAHKRGVVSMARAGNDPDSASSQFFICHKDLAHLDGNYATFGYAAYGFDVVDTIVRLERDADDKPLQKVTIEKAYFVQLKQQ